MKRMKARIDEKEYIKEREEMVLEVGSEASNREKVLHRAEHEIVQNRLSKNISSLSKLHHQPSHTKVSSYNHKYSKSRDNLPRGKPEDRGIYDFSRARILMQIVEKLKQQKEPQNFNRTGRRGNSYKLESVLRGIKKSNKESAQSGHRIVRKTQKVHSKTASNLLEEEKFNTLMNQLTKIKQALKGVQSRNEEMIQYLSSRSEISDSNEKGNGSTLTHLRNTNSYGNYEHPNFSQEFQAKYPPQRTEQFRQTFGNPSLSHRACYSSEIPYHYQ